MIETVRRASRNVKYWESDEMRLRWTAAGILEAEHRFRKIIGHAERCPTRARDRAPAAPPHHPHEMTASLT